MNDHPPIKFVECPFSRIVIGEKDILVLSYPGPLPQIAIQHLRESAQREFPGYQCIVLEEGLKLGALQVLC